MHFSERMRLSFTGAQLQSGSTGVEARKLRAVWSPVPIPGGAATSISGVCSPSLLAQHLRSLRWGRACRSMERMAQDYGLAWSLP